MRIGNVSRVIWPLVFDMNRFGPAALLLQVCD
jgi:hypothetical protein